jgi:hypothetical protein
VKQLCNNGYVRCPMKQVKSLLRYITHIIPALLITISAPCFATDRDTSLRTDLNFNYKINEQFQSAFYLFPQANDDISNYDYIEWGIGMQYQTPLTWLSFLVWYQQGYSKNDDRSWSLEQRPSINLNTSTTLYNFKISNQIRYEERIRSDWHDYRIKNTLVISRPDLFFQPSIGWELYYENGDKAVMLNRIKFGISKNIGNHVSLGPYYRMDFSNVNSRWEWTRQLIGFQVTINY